MINRIGNGGSSPGDPDLANSSAADGIESEVRLAHERHIDYGRVSVRHDMVIGKITRRGQAGLRIVFGRFHQRHADAHVDAADDLVPGGLECHDAAAVNHGDDTRDLHARQQRIDFHFNEIGSE